MDNDLKALCWFTLVAEGVFFVGGLLYAGSWFGVAMAIAFIVVGILPVMAIYFGKEWS